MDPPAPRPAPNTNPPDARTALLRSFGELVLSRRYADFGVSCIIGAARVARSTFYYHFRGKDELLLENLRPFVEALAKAALDGAVSPDLEQWIAHIWQHRATARRVLSGRTGDKIEAMLRDGVRDRLMAGPRPAPDAPITAEQVTGATLALLRGWVGHRFSASPQSLAQALSLGTTAFARPHAMDAPGDIAANGFAPLVFARAPMNEVI